MHLDKANNQLAVIMHNDSRGIRLAVGDIVVYSSVDTSSVTLGFVIGFTPHKVRIARRASGGAGFLKEPAYLLKVEVPDA